jgi:chromate transporter
MAPNDGAGAAAPRGTPSRAAPRATLRGILGTFLLLGATSFGGGVVAYLRQALVVRRGWLDDERFLSGLELSQILPGLNATNMSVYMGERLRGAPGAILALLGMSVPGAVVVMALGLLYQQHGKLPDVAAVLGGVGAAAVGLTLATTLQIGRRQLVELRAFAIVAVTFVAVGWFRLSLGLVLLTIAPLSIWLYWPRAAAATASQADA